MVRILLSTRLGERRLTQADLARMTGIRPNTISELYNEVATRISLDHIDLICEALGCDLTDLIMLVPNSEPRVKTRTGTNMSQSDYETLAALCDGTHGAPHEMTDDEARALIASEFGFAVEKVVIIHVVHAYEVNKHCQLRKSAEYIRRPMYDVSDYNYVRFDVDCGHMTWMYEMVNGELKTYDC